MKREMCNDNLLARQRRRRASLVPIGFAFAGMVAGGIFSSPTAHATALIVSDPFLQYYNVGPNNLFFTSGKLVRYGATSVTPNGDVGTTGTATTTNVSNGATINRTLGFFPSPAVPNFFSGSILLCGQAGASSCTATGNNNPANLTNPWTIKFSNATTSPTSVSTSLSLAGSGEIPFVNSVTLSGTAETPTFSWTPPPGLTVDGYRINIYQNNLQTFNANGGVVDTGNVTSRNVGPGTTSYTVTSADFTHGVALAPNTNYTIEISILQTRDGSTTTLTNNNVSAISRVYSNFQILPAGSPPINLPTVTVAGGQLIYGFDLTVGPSIIYYIDPAVATGYLYQIGAGDPDFASVSLPDIGNPHPYQLWLWDPTTSSFFFDTLLEPNTVFNFDQGGASKFKVLGIDPGLGLDPNNVTAFITALTFEGTGNFTGTMTPLTTNVPEPTTLALLGIGLAGLGFSRRRKPD